MTVPEPPFYHGTDEEGAASILTNGILSVPARHSKGHIADEVTAFYMTQYKDYAEDFAPGGAVVEIRFPSGGLFGGIDALDASAHMDGAEPVRRPEWWREFRAWAEREVRDAAVWEIVDTDKTPEEIIQNAIDKIDPNSGVDINNQQYAEKISRFADEKGYDLLHWNDTETVLLNFDAPDEIVPANSTARNAAERSL